MRLAIWWARLIVMVPVLTVPVWVTAADPAPVKPRPAALKRAEFALADGQLWGRAGTGGAFCKLTRKDLKWEAGQVQLHPTRLAATFKDALAEAGLASPDLFEKADAHDRLQVGAVVKTLDAQLCRDSPEGRSRKTLDKGALEMTIAWQVFDPARGETVLRLETQGHAEQAKAERDGLDHLVARAFLENARHAAADPALRDLLLAPAAAKAEPPAPIAAPAPKGIAEGPQPVLAARRAVVRISTGKRLGTGVLVAADGSVLTTRTAVGAAQFVTLTWPDGRTEVGEVVRTDIRRNLALVRAAPGAVAPPPLRRGKVAKGEAVFTLDAQAGAGAVRPGAVTALRALDGAGYLQTAIALNPEDTGAALVDANGAVIGVSVGDPEPDALPTGVSLFVRAGDALDILRTKPAAKVRRARR
jgi:serine protease Do